MDKKALKDFIVKKSKDYSYTIAFFLTFSFFVIFIIRPNVVSIAAAFSQIANLQSVNRTYDIQINRVIEIQSTIETYRSDLGLLREALSESPQVNKIISDLSEAASESNLEVNKINITEVNLKDANLAKKTKPIHVDLTLSGQYADMVSFVRGTYAQRRVKLIRKLTFAKPESESTESASLQLILDLEGYYL